METQDFNCSFSANIGAIEATEKIGKLPDWWGVGFNGHTEKQGDQFIVKMGGDSFFDFRVDELVPGKRIVWAVTDCNMPWYNDKKEWTNTRLIFDLKEADGETQLSFMHEGLTPDVECFKDCKPGWTHWITTSLKSYLTTGKGDFKQPGSK